MRILYYNWAYFNGSDCGGGVGVYQKNIIDEFLKTKKDSVSFLFSGEVYSPFSSKPFIQEIREKYGNCKVFALVNSTVVAPACFTFYNLQNYLNQNDTSILDLITDFINKQGGFDVLHFNNLEGLPLNVLRLKERLPKMKIVYTIHNYMPFCPLVNLFYFHELGTKVAENQLCHQLSQYKNGECLKIAYLGYVREDKGFFFLLNCLKELDEKIQKKIELKLIAGGIHSSRVKNLLKKIRNKFQKIDVVDGYTHENMASLLEGTHLGIIPVIWEDNLPQVAIELVSMGIPILCSSAGGASELSTSPYFKFKVADIQDFNEKLSYIQKHPHILEDYWAKHNKLVTMKQHIQNLLSFYRNSQTPSVNDF